MTRFLFRLTLLLVVLAPIPFGSNREWSWTLCAVLAAALTALWVLDNLRQRGQVSLSLNPAIIILFLLTCAWVVVQMSSLVPMSWKHPMWGMVAAALDTSLPGAITLSVDDSLTALMRLVCYGLVFSLAFQLCRDRRKAQSALKWIAFAGLVYAVYGLVVYWGDFKSVLWYYDDAFHQDVRATFINRNNFATYLGLSLLCAIAVFYQKLLHRQASVYHMPQSRQMEIKHYILKSWKPLLGLSLMVTALVSTHSRGGFVSTFIGCVVLLFLLDRKQITKSIRSRVVITSAVVVAGMAFWVSSEILLNRLAQTSLDREGRITAYQVISESILDNPLHGFGYGTFTDSFRLYRTDDMKGHLNKAHNTYLENVFELGWPAASSLSMAIMGLGLTCIFGIRRRQRDWVYPSVGVAATILVALHSLVDFSLQIPAVAITYACIMGVACAQSYSSRQKPSS